MEMQTKEMKMSSFLNMLSLLDKQLGTKFYFFLKYSALKILYVLNLRWNKETLKKLNN
jgi:hypothetical protein